MSYFQKRIIGERYELLERLGKGAMCHVVKARDIESNKIVAVKIPRRLLIKHPKGLARFAREARNTVRLRHHNIIRVLEIRKERRIPFFAMEYVDGGDLQRALKRGITLQEGVDIILQVTAALECARAKGITHRDLKPANILITKKGHAKVADWGLSKADHCFESDSITVTGAAIGTPLYMAPEQMRGQGATSRSDLYAVGLMLYEIAVAASPSGKALPKDDFMRHLVDGLPPLDEQAPGTPKELVELVHRLLSHDPSERPSEPMEVAHLLRRAMGMEKKKARVTKRVEAPSLSARPEDDTVRVAPLSKRYPSENAVSLTRSEEDVSKLKQKSELPFLERFIQPELPIMGALVAINVVVFIFVVYLYSR
mgnify:CR=1 FL=1